MNNQLWHTAANANNNTSFPLTEKNVSAVKNAEGKKAKSLSTAEKSNVPPARYHFDGNGGGYNGL